MSAAIFQRKIQVSEASTIFGSSFGSNGWHHICKTLQEYDANPDIDYRDTTMYFFLKYFVPTSICDFIDVKCKTDCKLPLFVYPWGTFQKNVCVSDKEPYLSRFCGPSSDDFIKEEFDRTIALYKKIKKTGYQPWRYGNTFIGGTFLIHKSGEKRFVVLQGNHRMSILAHIGYKKIPVRDVKGVMTKVKESDIPNWSLVKSGQCTKDIADSVFDLFFKENGRHIKNIISEGKITAKESKI